MKNSNKFGTKIVLSLVLSSLIQAETLKEVVEDVLNTNPIILERLNNYNAVREDVTVSKADYLPKLDLRVAGGHEQTTKETLNNNNPVNLNVYESSLKLTQNVFRGFNTYYDVRANEARKAAAAYKYVEQANMVSLDMARTYMEVLRNRDLLINEEDNVKINEEIFVKVKKLYDNGLTTLSEVNKIESSLSLAMSNYTVKQNDLKDATHNLHRILGRYIDIKDMKYPTCTLSLPKSREDALEYAIKNNPSLLVSNFDIKFAQEALKQSRSAYMPTVDLEVTQDFNKNSGGYVGDDNKFRAMAVMNYNLFNGFSDQATVQKRVSLVNEEVQLKNKLRRDTIEELNLGWEKHEMKKDQLAHLRKYKEFSLKTLTLYSKEYDLGRRTLLDLLSSQNDFVSSKAQIINAETDILIAKMRVLDSMGAFVISVINDDKRSTMYSNVGLGKKAEVAKDTLPAKIDTDGDLIANDEDLSDNSLKTKPLSFYGQAIFDGSVTKTLHYGFLTYTDEDSTTLDENSTQQLNDMLEDIANLDRDRLKIVVYSHTDDSFSKDESMQLSKERADKIMAQIQDAGVAKENIVADALGKIVPLYIDEGNAVEANNRTEVLIQQLAPEPVKDVVDENKTEVDELDDMPSDDSEMPDDDSIVAEPLATNETSIDGTDTALPVVVEERYNADTLETTTYNDAASGITVISEGGTAVVEATELKIRELPDTASQVLGYYYSGDTIDVEQKIRNNLDQMWIKTKKGYISANYVSFN
ncbi:MAG: TolC family outer membrane protein [Campylobacterota bacterium]|nr:TolC family outer membrane protein [Campylobacterota bacterium]